jgi:hypothetical protein
MVLHPGFRVIVNYLSNGSKGQLKEKVEALNDVHVARLNSGQVLKHEVPHLKTRGMRKDYL